MVSQQLTRLVSPSVAFSKKVDPENPAILKLEQFCKVRFSSFSLLIEFRLTL